MTESSNPYSATTTKATASDSAPPPSMIVRGVRVGLAVGLSLGICLAGFFFVMHGGTISVVTVLAFLAGPTLGVLLGVGLAAMSRRERSN